MFTDALELKLKLTIAGTELKIKGGNVKTLALELHQYGFICQLSFWVSSEEKEDPLYPLFITQDLIKVKLDVLPYYNPKEVTLEPIGLTGLVTDKKILVERTIENVNVEGNPVLYRYYQIDFADPAQVLWRQHFPCDLFTKSCMKDILEAHKGRSITLDCDGWDVLDKQHAINTVPLGTAENKASFYDFVMWYVHSLGGVLTYDCNKNTYIFSASKKDDGQPKEMDKEDVEEFQVEFMETIRHTPHVLNAYSDDPKREAIDHEQSVDGVRRDYIGRFPIASDFTNRQDLETQRFINRQHEIQVTFRNFPCLPHRPGCMVKLEGPGWSKEILAHGKVYRVRDISITARSTKDEVTADQNMPFAEYNIDMKSQLELQDEKWVSLPPFQCPVFPLYVEGKIKSEQGDDEERTYQIYQDEETSQDQYKVIIPLWYDQEVVVPFEPGYFSGHFYFPAYKMSRVLVALDFHSARIERFLDWKEESRLQMDTQGNHLLFGKTPQNRTSINHVYEKEKPVLNVKRTMDIDTQSIRFEEGRLILETKEGE